GGRVAGSAGREAPRRPPRRAARRGRPGVGLARPRPPPRVRLAGLGEPAAARRCRRDVPPRALEDAHAELLLERRDAAAERRLADLQRGGGTAEVAVARQHDGGLQQTEGDIHAGNVSAWPVVCLLGRAAFPPPSLGVALLK